MRHFLNDRWWQLAARCEGLWLKAALGLQAGGACVPSLAPRKAQLAGVI